MVSHFVAAVALLQALVQLFRLQICHDLIGDTCMQGAHDFLNEYTYVNGSIHSYRALEE